MVKAVANTQLEIDAQIASLDDTKFGKPRDKQTHYARKSTIILGMAGSNIVIQDFKIHEEILVNIFNRANMPTTGLITTGLKPTVAAAAPANPKLPGVLESFDPSALDFEAIARGGLGKGFIGKLVRIPLPTGAAAKLVKRKYFKGLPRKNAWIMFPKQASRMAIAHWIATHVDITYKDEINAFFMPSGTRVSFNPTKADVNDPAIIAKIVGSFSNNYRTKLKGTEAN